VLNRASRAEHERRGVLNPRGLMAVAKERDTEQFEADLISMQLDEIDVEEAFARVPILSPDVTRAALHEDAHDIDTDKLLQGFAKDARAEGAEILTGFKVTRIARGTVWSIESNGRTFEAEKLVNAAGAWADQVAQLAGVTPLGLQPMRRSMARLPAPDGHNLSKWPMIFGPGESWYAKPDAGGWIVSPAEEDPIEPMDAWPEDMVLAEGLDRYQQYVTSPVIRLETSWAGLRTFSPDRSLVLGEDPDVSGFFWCAGQGGYGIQSSPAAGRCIADLVLGRQPELPIKTIKALSPSRFR
ncbi:MAG: FAD-binding oxidoreductase, partial [Boseongicola sp.]|nr:FAD-binding oxidoreductase [Boseongicola sp.]